MFLQSALTSHTGTEALHSFTSKKIKSKYYSINWTTTLCRWLFEIQWSPSKSSLHSAPFAPRCQTCWMLQVVGKPTCTLAVTAHATSFWPIHLSVFILNSRSAPTNCDPLSHRSSKTSPRWFMNLRRHIIKSSLSIELTNSKCTLRIFRRVMLSISPTMLNVQRTEQVHAC